MSFVGFNEEQVDGMVKTINDIANTVCNGIVDHLTNGLVVPMADCWFTPEGKEYFEGHAQDVINTSTSIASALNVFIARTEAATKNWLSNTGGTQGEGLASSFNINRVDDGVIRGQLQTYSGNVDTNIKTQKPNGDKGIEETEARNVISKLGSIQSEIIADIKSQFKAVDASAAFLGKDQATAASECLDKISQAIGNIFKLLTEGENNVYGEIDKAVEKYGNVADQGVKNLYNQDIVEEK